MNDKPSRKFWQFHLSTAIALVLVAGALIGANLRDRAFRPPPTPQLDRDLFEIHAVPEQYGWPIIANEVQQGTIRSPGEPIDLESKWNNTAVIVDSLVAIGILFAVALVFELVARRREARKP